MTKVRKTQNSDLSIYNLHLTVGSQTIGATRRTSATLALPEPETVPASKRVLSGIVSNQRPLLGGVNPGNSEGKDSDSGREITGD